MTWTGCDGGNSRNGYRAKTMIIEAEPVDISVPRTGIQLRAENRRQGQRRLTRVDGMAISLSM